MTHPSRQLDDLVHQRVRLGILAVLSEVRRADFVYLRDALDLTDGNLSRHLHVLEEAGYVRRTATATIPSQLVSLTAHGLETALDGEIDVSASLPIRVSGLFFVSGRMSGDGGACSGWAWFRILGEPERLKQRVAYLAHEILGRGVEEVVHGGEHLGPRIVQERLEGLGSGASAAHGAKPCAGAPYTGVVEGHIPSLVPGPKPGL